MSRTYLKIGLEHGASVALAEQGVQAEGIAKGYVSACRTPLCQMRRRIPLEQSDFRVWRR